MRVAALYDVHGNLPALEAVLAEVERDAFDTVLVGGDVASGPLPVETLDALRALGDRARFIRGNADRELVEGGGPGLSDIWCVEQLGEERLGFLGGLPQTISLQVQGLGHLLFCHGSPRSDEEILTRVSSQERLRDALHGVDASIVICGHTHVQFDLNVSGIRLVNAGSVGLPYEREPGARWASFGPDVALRCTRYDEEGAASRLLAGGAPGAAEFVRMAYRERPGPEEATAFFEHLAVEGPPR